MVKTKERFRFIKGFDRIYKIGNHGTILTKRRRGGQPHKPAKIKWHILAQHAPRDYYQVSIGVNGNIKSKLVHVLVAIHFVNNPKGLKSVNHKDGNKLNNHASNLEWVNHRENITHYWSKKNKSSTLVGATWNKHRKTFSSRININGKNLYLGSFKTDIEAHLAYMSALKNRGIINKYAGK